MRIGRLFVYLQQWSKMRLPAFVYLTVCLLSLLARLLKNAWIDLDEMLHVDRCRDMEELIIF